MRKRIFRDLRFGTVPIEEVDLSEKSRHQLPKLLKALQHIYMQPHLREAVLDIIEKKVYARLKKKNVGKLGMSFWEIWVFALVRSNLNIDYDNLQDLGNNHINMRGILGVLNVTDFSQGWVYKLQTIKDNVALLDEACLMEISKIVVIEGHHLIKKKQAAAEKQEQDLSKDADSFSLNVKVDSFVVLSNIHFPTDINLLWDCARKVLDYLAKIISNVPIKGLREYRGLLNKIRNGYRNASEIHRKKGKNFASRLKVSCENYINLATELVEKIGEAKAELLAYAAADIKHAVLVEQLYYYLGLLNKHIDLVRRRILQGEKIEHCEKMFSIFETYSKWLKKGKPNGLVELGLNVNVATCQYSFILHHHVMEKEVDVDMTVPTAEQISQNYTASQNYYLNRISYDGNYYSALAKKAVGEIFSEVIIPKKGKKTVAEKEQESEAAFKEGRRAHSAVESNIHALEQHGLDRCPDRSIAHFKRYVALGVLSYNLTLLGALL